MEDQTLQPQSNEGIDVIDIFFERMLHSAPVIGNGKDGIVLKIDISSIDESTINAIKEAGIDLSTDNGYAVKLLKIYRPGEGKKEYDIQKAAYDLLKDLEGVAKIPKPIILRVQHLSQPDKEYLKKYHTFIDDNAEIILMDYIEGKDLATHIYDFILFRNNYDESTLLNMDFEQKQELVGNILNFEMPTNRVPGDFRDIMAMRDNLRKLMQRLKRYNFSIDEKTLDQIKESLTILESNGIFHNDLHERNILLGEDGQPYIIDFGRSVNNRDNQESDDFTIVRRFQNLNKRGDSEQEATYWKDLIDRVSTSPKLEKVINDWTGYLKTNEDDRISDAISASTANETDFERSLAIIAHLHNISKNKKIKQKITTIIQNLDPLIKHPYAKRKFENFKRLFNE